MPATSALQHLTPRERSDLGKHARARVPREAHGDWAPAADRTDPIDLLDQQARTRLPDLIPIRHGRMVANPFAFFRGSALIMAADLSRAPVTGFSVQACGDAHLSNFGLFASPERQLVFDINDFDETLNGPWEWDVKRLAASLEIAGRNNGFTTKQRRRIVVEATEAYRRSIRSFATMSNLAIWYLQAQVQQDLPRATAALDKDSLRQVQKVISKAMTKDSQQALGRLTTIEDGVRRFVSEPPLIVDVDELLPAHDATAYMAQIHDALRKARTNLPDERRLLLEQYRFSGLAQKVVGVGSVGTRTAVLLMLGRDDHDVLMLQAKEAEASVLERFLRPSRYSQHGRRVVEGQKRTQATSDIFLSWSRVEAGLDGRPHDFYFRQLRDWKGSWEPDQMNPIGMKFFAGMCAWTLARAHARTGDRIAIASYLGGRDTFDQAVARFAVAYADQNDRDHGALATAIDEGRILAHTGI